MLHFMHHMSDWNDFLQRLRLELVQFTPKDHSRMIGLLFARPDSELAQKEVLPHLGYFHVRSAEHITFYCVGYSPEQTWGDEEVVAEFEGTRWTFSNKKFNSMRELLEYRTKWRYSGMVDLIIANSTIPQRPDETHFVTIDFSSAICVNLDQLKEIKAIPSIEALFELIFRYAENPDPINPSSGLSDEAGLKIARSAFKNLIFSLLPEPLKPEVEKALHLAVRDIDETN